MKNDIKVDVLIKKESLLVYRDMVSGFGFINRSKECNSTPYVIVFAIIVI